MTEMDWATGADDDTGVTEMDGASGNKYLGDPASAKTKFASLNLISLL